MADREQKIKTPSAGGSAVVMMEKTTSQSKQKAFRPTALLDDTPVELRHKRSRAPAVPSVAEEYKDLPENAVIGAQKESKLAMPSQKPSTKSSKREKSPEAIPMAPIERDVQRVETVSTAQPIPALPTLKPATRIDVADDKDSIDNDDSITEEITDLRVAESSNKEWSDEEAGGLPRSESRASRGSRVSRLWRQLFCCGVPYEAPSEHNDTTNGSQKSVPENQETEETVPLPRTLVSEITNKLDNETVNKTEDPVQDLPLQRKAASVTVNEGITSTKQIKKKEISWTQPTYLDKVQLQDSNSRSVPWLLDRRASVGPCFRKTLPYGEPSGITICLPKKSVKSFNENIKPSKSGGININMSKWYGGHWELSEKYGKVIFMNGYSTMISYAKISLRCLDINTKLLSDCELRMRTDRVVIPRRETRIGIKIEEGTNFLDNLKGKLDNWRGRIKHVLHM